MASSSLRYIKLDYESHRDAILQRVQSRFPLVWNDFLASSIGIMLVDLIAWSTATLAFIVNRIAAENFIPTMTLRESAVRLGALVNYKLRSATPASVMCSARIAGPIAYDVTIPKGAQVRTSSGSNLVYEVDDTYVIKAGQTTPQTLVATFDSSLSGLNRTDYLTNLTAIQSASYLDLIDTSINLAEFVQSGMLFMPDGSSQIYTVTGVSSATDAISNNRMLISPVWQGESATVTGKVVDPRILILQGQTVSDVFLTPATSQPNYTVTLPRTAVITGSISVSFNGTMWTEVSSLLVQDSDATVFQTYTKADGTTTLVFGDDTFGQAIPMEATCRINYRVGGGTIGNVDAGQIQTTVVGRVESPNTPIVVSISNAYSTGYGGLDSETLEEARVNIPAYARSNDKAVTLDDFQTIARQFTSAQYGAIAQARAESRKKNAIVESNLVTVYAWTRGAAGKLSPISTGMRGALQAYLQSKCMATDYVLVAEGKATPIPISVRVNSDPTYQPKVVEQLVLDSIVSQTSALIPGQPLVYSDLVRALDSITGVRSVSVATPTSDLFPSSSNEVFTPPDGAYEASIAISGNGSSGYHGTLPSYPVSPWCIKIKINGLDTLITPDNEAGYARILSSVVSFYTEGLLEDRPVANNGRRGNYFYATDVDTLYQCRLSGVVYAWISVQKGVAGPSRIDCRTGELTIFSSQVISSVSAQYVPVISYNNERYVDVFVGYEVTGYDSSILRKNIREAIQKFFDGVEPGGIVYASEQSGVISSLCNIKSVVAKVDGVSKVTRVALDTVGNTAVRVEATAYSQLRSGTIVLNGASY